LTAVNRFGSGVDCCDDGDAAGVAAAPESTFVGEAAGSADATDADASVDGDCVIVLDAPSSPPLAGVARGEIVAAVLGASLCVAV
jgi:hypothetical protein